MFVVSTELPVQLVNSMLGRKIHSKKGIDWFQNYKYAVHMDDLHFEWAEKKNKENIKKHKVSFEEAQTVFLDENALRFFDPDHSEDEDRFIMLGLSFKLRVILVCHCYRKDDTAISITSARKADKSEAKNYWR